MPPLADAARGKVAIDDRVDLVGSLRRLIDALAVERDDPLGGGETAEEARDILGRQPGTECRRRDVGRDRSRRGERRLEVLGVGCDVILIEMAVVGQVHQQPGKQGGVLAWRDRQVQAGAFCGRRLAHIDGHDHRAPRVLRLDHALEQDRVAPGGVGPDEDEEVRLVQIRVAAGNRIRAEGALVTRYGRRHAEPRIGIDIGRADESLHQLVGNVIILREKLTGKIKPDGRGAVLVDDPAKPRRDMIDGGLPIDPFAHDLGIELTRLEAERLAERRSLRAQTTVIRRMLGISRDRGAPDPIWRREDPAPDTAIRTRGLDSDRQGPGLNTRRPDNARTSSSPR